MLRRREPHAICVEDDGNLVLRSGQGETDPLGRGGQCLPTRCDETREVFLRHRDRSGRLIVSLSFGQHREGTGAIAPNGEQQRRVVALRQSVLATNALTREAFGQEPREERFAVHLALGQRQAEGNGEA